MSGRRRERKRQRRGEGELGRGFPMEIDLVFRRLLFKFPEGSFKLLLLLLLLLLLFVPADTVSQSVPPMMCQSNKWHWEEMETHTPTHTHTHTHMHTHMSSQHG